jgi:hypothetical protein
MTDVATCARCRDTYWVCEAHDDRPWDGEHACGCGAAGMPCPACNPSDRDHPPRPPAGFTVDQTTIPWWRRLRRALFE